VKAKALIVLGAVSPLVLFGCGTTTHGTGARAPSQSPAQPLTYAAYPALNLARPPGIAVVSLAQAHSVVADKARPIWVEVTPEDPNATLPEIRSAREVRHEGPRRVWLSKSDRGGLCLLIFDPAESPDPATDHSVTATCGEASELAKGISLVQRLGGSANGEKTFVVGVVPNGVATVSIKLAGGEVHAASVADDTYSVMLDRRVAEVSFVRHGVRTHQSI